MSDMYETRIRGWSIIGCGAGSLWLNTRAAYPVNAETPITATVTTSPSGDLLLTVTDGDIVETYDLRPLDYSIHGTVGERSVLLGMATWLGGSPLTGGVYPLLTVPYGARVPQAPLAGS